MGIFDSGGGGTQQVTNTTVQQLTPEQQRLFNLAVPQLEQTAQNPPQLYPYSTIPNFNPYEQLAQGGVLTASGGPVADVAGGAAGASNFFTSGAALDPASNPALAGAIQGAINPIYRELTRTTLPQVRSGAIDRGQFGGSRQGIAEGIAISDANQQAFDTSAALQNQAFQNVMDNLVRTIGLAPQTAQLQYAPALGVGAVGAQQRGLETAQLQDAANRYMSEQLIPYQISRDIAGLAAGLPGGTVTGTATGPAAATTSPFASGLGGALSGASLASMLAFNPAVGAGLGALLGILG